MVLIEKSSGSGFDILHLLNLSNHNSIDIISKKSMNVESFTIEI